MYRRERLVIVRLFRYLFFYFTESEHLLSGQLDKLATDIAVLVFETDEIPCRDIVRLVELLS